MQLQLLFIAFVVTLMFHIVITCVTAYLLKVKYHQIKFINLQASSRLIYYLSKVFEVDFDFKPIFVLWFLSQTISNPSSRKYPSIYIVSSIRVVEKKHLILAQYFCKTCFCYRVSCFTVFDILDPDCTLPQ